MMGMFDDITCEYPLPRADMQGRAFQTKSLDNEMAQFTITTEGRLLENLHDWDNDPDTPMGQRWIETGETRDTEYHGDIYFYAFARPKDYESGLVTFRARFTDGQLQWIKVVENA